MKLEKEDFKYIFFAIGTLVTIFSIQIIQLQILFSVFLVFIANLYLAGKEFKKYDQKIKIIKDKLNLGVKYVK